MTALVLVAAIFTTALLTGGATAFATSRRRGYVGRHRATW
ncbi:Uncharacterised protein [Mycobacterium tuberculosis]|nr:Uncharacterised protein [Mycobacterium tuberculosis]